VTNTALDPITVGPTITSPANDNSIDQIITIGIENVPEDNAPLSTPPAPESPGSVQKSVLNPGDG
jgi:hypothetical protein